MKSAKSVEKPRRQRSGRPPYRPTPEDRLSVEQMKFCGEAERVIARSLGIDIATLTKHFAVELADGHANRRKEVIGLLFGSARTGNISAQRRLEEIGRAAGAAEALDHRATPTVRLGKKEEKQAAAERVTGKFAPPPPPKLVVSN